VPVILPPGYRIRGGTVADISLLVHHRVAMFTEMGLTFDHEATADAFGTWLGQHLPSGTYRGWVAEANGEVVAGAGITQLTWPPGPHEFSGRLPIVYNVYTEPMHRRRGLARALMETVHAWCRDAGYSAVGLAASTYGRGLYEALGYRESPSPYMFLTL
jgi:GNAT superfamily N-acetyltransferase